MSKILSSFVYAFAVTEWQLYLGRSNFLKQDVFFTNYTLPAPLVEILNGTSFIAMRSIATKLVESDELGKVNSLFGVAEALMPLVYAPMYASLYQATIETLPGAFFLVGGALTAPAVIIFLWMYRMNKRDLQLKAKESNNVVIDCKTIPPKKDFEENGFENPTFISDNSTKQDILDQTIEIVKEYPHSRKNKT